MMSRSIGIGKSVPVHMALGMRNGWISAAPSGMMPAMEALTLMAPAKINLVLRVLNRRPDGYHEIDSLMVPLSLADTIQISPGEHGINLRCPGHPELDAEHNLAYRAATELLSACSETKRGFNIMIHKEIPIGAGLGGGSSDAAAVLEGMNHMLGFPVRAEKLHQIAAGLGADVPFFLGHGPARARGIGTQLDPVDGLPSFWLLLACAPFSLSTRQVYESLNFPLTSPTSNGKSVRLFSSLGFHQLALQLWNDLQETSEVLFPVIRKACKEMVRVEAAATLMTGSGPTVFGLFQTREEARRARTKMRKETDWKYLVVEGLSVLKMRH